MADDIVLRPATAADAEPAARIAADVFAGVSVDFCIEAHFGPLNSTLWQERKAAQIEAEVLACPEAVIVADRAGGIIGFVTTEYDPSTRVGRIPNLAVSGAAQGHGVGKLLMQAACELLVSHGATHLQIETLETNDRGMRFYPRLGFREVARKIYYFMEVQQWQPPV